MKPRAKIRTALNQAKSIAGIVLYLALAGSASAVAWKLCVLFDEARVAFAHTDAEINKHTLPNFNFQLGTVADSTARTADAIASIQGDIHKRVVPRLDKNLDAAATSITSASADIKAIRQQAVRLIVISGGVARNIELATRDLDDQEKAQAASLNATTVGMVKLTQDADNLVDDPSLTATLQSLSVTTKNLGEVTGNAAKLSDFYYKKLTSPVSLAKEVALGVAHYSALFAGALVGSWH